ncbi:MAG: DsbA family protein [Candidatus Shapirobacteria bacterium]
MSKETIIVLTLVIAAFFGGYYFSNSQNKNAPTQANTPTTVQQQAPQATTTVNIDQVKALFTDKNIVFGDKNSKLLFVVVSDPSCPYCHVASGKNSALNKQMGAQFLLKADGGTYVAPEVEIKKLVDSGKAAMVWFYANGHGSGELATEALYCANESGKFWQVHDKLMSAEGYDLMNKTIGADKTKTGVMADFLKNEFDTKAMKSCLDSGKYTNRLAEDMAVAQQIGFEGTPYFLVNTVRFVGAYSFSEMQSAVDEALK